MTREQYMSILRDNGFIFKRSQIARPGRLGEEDVYIHPSYMYQFYITRTDTNAPYGFNAQRTAGAVFDKIYPHNATGDKDYYFWTDKAFVELMKRLGKKHPKKQWTKQDDETLITVILPTINNP